MFYRCPGCFEMYRVVIDPVTTHPRWEPPLVKRGGCKHDVGIETFTGDQWDVRSFEATS